MSEKVVRRIDRRTTKKKLYGAFESNRMAGNNLYQEIENMRYGQCFNLKEIESIVQKTSGGGISFASVLRHYKSSLCIFCIKLCKEIGTMS